MTTSMRSDSEQQHHRVAAASVQQQKAEAGIVVQNKLGETAQNGVHAAAQLALDARLNDSPRMSLQRMKMADMGGEPAQLAGVEEEEPMQGKFATAQLAGVEEEEPLQGKFATAQLAGPEEELQMKAKTAQLAGPEEELQMKSKTAQLAGPEEELQMKSKTAQLAGPEEELQMKSKTAQLAGPEEELQMKSKTAQLAGPEEELQMKSATTQLAGVEEEEPMQGKFAGALVQRKENKTGMPDNLKAGVESLSGMAMDDVRVHYGSDKPAQVQAHAYAQGSDIHVAPGQEKHLPHEAWHVVQQKQGRVQPTMQAAGMAINDDVGLESEADVMGAKALQTKPMERE